MATYGLTINGPFVAFLFHRVYDRMPGGPPGVFYRILFNSTVHTFLTIALFFTGLNLLRGNPTSQIQADLEQKYWPTVLGSWRFWPFVHIITFSVIKSQYQMQFAGTMGILFNMYLSYQAYDL